MQKIFIKIHESKHLYNEKYKFEQWLFVIARTSVLDHFRSSQRYNKRITESASMNLMGSISSDIKLLNSTPFLHLDEKQKELLQMKYIDELSYQEIASIFNKSESSLRKMVSRLVINLRKGEV
jgi:RNA polymerase sigma-70 factor (ECF subfamily)